MFIFNESKISVTNFQQDSWQRHTSVLVFPKLSRDIPGRLKDGIVKVVCCVMLGVQPNEQGMLQAP